jgi:hypothetical protein
VNLFAAWFAKMQANDADPPGACCAISTTGPMTASL